MKILVTGSNGFIGKNICVWLKNHNHIVLMFDKDNTEQELVKYLKECDWIVHLAGINRPLALEEFYNGNVNFTKRLADLAKMYCADTSIIFTSSIQAELDNDYGISKRMAEDYLLSSGLNVYIYRLANVFGKWCAPNYNSVVATFCHNVANDLPLTIRDENHVVKFNYIDDVCDEFINRMEGTISVPNEQILSVYPIYNCSLGKLSNLLLSFKASRINKYVPEIRDDFERKLYATYLTYLPKSNFSYLLDTHQDNRGSFTEFMRTNYCGQFSVNIAHPGITKGNHYHHTKNEKFLTVYGECVIKFRKIGTDEIIIYNVSGSKLEVVDIPPGYTHSITTIGQTDSVTIMWADEVFTPNIPDTHFEEVEPNGN